MNVHRNSVYFLVVAVIGLIALGLVMLSSTAAFAPGNHGDQLWFLKRQGLWLGAAVLVCSVAACVDYHLLGRLWWLLFGVAFVLLLLCFVPGIAKPVNGAWRWISVGPAQLQPSEVAKLALVVALAWWFARDEGIAETFWQGFAAPLVALAILVVPIAIEVDMGTTALLTTTTLILMFVAGTRWRYLVPMMVLGICSLGVAITKMPERLGRVLAFLHPEKYPDDAYQQLQGLIAFGSGGVEGLGLGNGRQKMLFLPEAHTDFILPTLGEELGLRMTLLVVFGFIVVIMCGAMIALRARDRFGMLLGFGIVILIALQAAVNIGVTTMVLPNKGFPLPFISYGGSNLIFCLLGVGILINIYRQGLTEKEEKARVVLPARVKNRRLPCRL
ncbi:MAG TPA: putative peptidoglycan glycosyltransferase FtsW [Chthoniobacteraceae bacterium]